VTRYRFALRPLWLLSHALIVVIVVVMVSLGFWQLRRLDDRRAYTTSVEANESLPATSIDSLLATDDPTSRGDDLAFRHVTARGRYDVDNEVIIRARSLNERPGVWVATPLRLANGDGVLVVRGFLPTQGTPDRVPQEAEPPSGDVTIEGFLQPTQTKGTFGATDPKDGKLANLARVDVERIEQQVGYRLYPAYVQLTSSQPAPAGPVPELLQPPALDEGPHLSYAIQWFIFSTIAVVGYPLILRRSARNREREDAEDAETDSSAEPKSRLVKVE